MNLKFWTKKAAAKAEPQQEEFDAPGFYALKAAQMAERFPVGFEFFYLDRPMVVRRYTYYIESFESYYGYRRCSLPTIVCDYCDNDGVIRDMVFEFGFWEALERMAVVAFEVTEGDV